MLRFKQAVLSPHFVVSKTLDRVAWKNTRIVRDVEEIRKMKQLPGKDMHAVGGATLVCSLMNLDLIDELRLVVVLVVLGAGKALFKDVKKRHALKLVEVKPLESGKVRLTYSL
jgi:dihydrofolate reductase